MKVKDEICTDNPMDGHDKFCPIWIVGDRIMTECECELIHKVQADCEQRVLNLVRADERKRAVFIAQHSIEDHYARDDAIAWINGETPKWWTGNQP